MPIRPRTLQILIHSALEQIKAAALVNEDEICKAYDHNDCHYDGTDVPKLALTAKIILSPAKKHLGYTASAAVFWNTKTILETPGIELNTEPDMLAGAMPGTAKDLPVSEVTFPPGSGPALRKAAKSLADAGVGVTVEQGSLAPDSALEITEKNLEKSRDYSGARET